MIRIVPLPYQPDSCDYFSRLRGLPGAVFLDSARPHGGRGRFDLMSALPLATLRSRGDESVVDGPRGTTRFGADDPFLLLERLLEAHVPAGRALTGEWPFAGGAIGCFGYGLGRRVAGLAPRAQAGFPDLSVGIYPWALAQDHDRRQCAAIFTEAVEKARREHLLGLLQRSPVTAAAVPFRLESAFRSNLDQDAYRRAFARIRDYIHAGDCYQVNFAQRLSARASGDPWSAYLRLRRRMASPFSAFLHTADGAVLSFSPERFLHLVDGRVETRPIKGTVRRGTSAGADRRQAERLLASEKDRAENIMIVDLMRNDLGKSCRTGSVHVETLCGLESYANVHHLVSVVTGQLEPGRSAARLLGDCFPGGSITGAPKIRAMQIIDELEPDPRSVYCGSIGYLSWHGTMDTSIAIRSLLYDGREVHAWGGGGIVADSDCETEYRESLTKIEPLLNGLIACAGEPPLRVPAGSRP